MYNGKLKIRTDTFQFGDTYGKTHDVKAKIDKIEYKLKSKITDNEQKQNKNTELKQQRWSFSEINYSV